MRRPSSERSSSAKRSLGIDWNSRQSTGRFEWLARIGYFHSGREADIAEWKMMKFAVLSQSGIRRYRVERAVQKLQAPQPRNPWRALSPSSKLRMKDWTCRSTFAAPRRNRPFASPAKRPTRPDRYIWPNSQSIAPTRHRATRRRRLRRQCARGRDPLSPRG